MAVAKKERTYNAHVFFVPYMKDHHEGPCVICGRQGLNQKAVAAHFSEAEHPSLAAVYCATCIEGIIAVQKR